MANLFIGVLPKAVLPKAGRFAEGARRPSAYSTSAAIRIAPARGEAAMIKQVFERYLSLPMYPVLALGSNKRLIYRGGPYASRHCISTARVSAIRTGGSAEWRSDADIDARRAPPRTSRLP